MTAEAVQALSARERRRLIALGMLRASAITVGLVALYFLLPLDQLTDLPLWLLLTLGLVVLTAVSIYQVRAVIRDRRPAVRAVEALATTGPLFLLLFSAAYYLLAQDSPTNFNAHTLTRTDALYFTVTVFSTVGFGDITATSQAARLMVTAQMILDLLVLGLGIRVFIGAVQLARRRPGPASGPPDASE